MAKGWTTIVTINDVPKGELKTAAWKAFENKHRNDKPMKAEDLKKAGNQRFREKMAHQEQLIEAYNEKKLKSKDLIREARSIIKAREEAAKKLAEKKAAKAEK